MPYCLLQDQELNNRFNYQIGNPNWDLVANRNFGCRIADHSFGFDQPIDFHHTLLHLHMDFVAGRNSSHIVDFDHNLGFGFGVDSVESFELNLGLFRLTL